MEDGSLELRIPVEIWVDKKMLFPLIVILMLRAGSGRGDGAVCGWAVGYEAIFSFAIADAIIKK